jgi:hypothetical protein
LDGWYAAFTAKINTNVRDERRYSNTLIIEHNEKGVNTLHRPASELLASGKYPAGLLL